MISTILDAARAQQKNILILGSPRSGTHALGREFAWVDSSVDNLGEICVMGRSSEPHQEITRLFKTDDLTVAHVVQMLPKFRLALRVDQIKRHAVVVCLRRKNKIKQFASSYYSKHLHKGKWHNVTEEHFQAKIGQIEASEQDIMQFIQEQIIDDFFLPDFNLCYENIKFQQTKINQNCYPFEIEKIFSNIEYIKSVLNQWTYCEEHLQ